MSAFICTTCGVQYPPAETPPAQCTICEEERQYVPVTGQGWIAPERMAGRYANTFVQQEDNLIGIGTVPTFAIGQRALLIRTPAGNVLWDCISLLDDATVTTIKAMGGLAAIAISHPHFYTTMVAWSRAFDAPVHLHAADRQWIMRPDSALKFWEGETRQLLPGLTLIRGGGHFTGGTMLHWAAGAGGKGALLAADIATVTPDRKFVSFMYSYPNLIPLNARAVQAIAASVEPYAFDRIYSHFFDRVIAAGAKQAFAVSVARYLKAIGN